MADDEKNRPLAVILTALRLEADAVCDFLTAIHEENFKGSIYRRGIFVEKDHPWDVVVVQTGPGGYRAAIETERTITYYDARIVFFIGVAGGRKDVNLGDVVVATKIYAYESGKDDDTFQTRPEVGMPSYRLEQLAEAEARKTDWLKRLKKIQQNHTPRIFSGPVAAGGSVITSFDSETEKRLQRSYSDALAIEMEGHGFFEAVHRNDQQVDALVIRGISDLLKDKKEADANKFQEIASHHASAFAFELLAKLQLIEYQQKNKENNSTTTTTPPGAPAEASTQEKIPPGMDTLPGGSDNYQPPTAPTSTPLQRCYIEIRKAYDQFSEKRQKFPDHCQHLIDPLTKLYALIEQSPNNILPFDRVIRKRQTDIKKLIGQTKDDLQEFQVKCQQGTQNQHQDLYQNIRRHLDRLLKDLELLSRDL